MQKCGEVALDHQVVRGLLERQSVDGPIIDATKLEHGLPPDSSPPPISFLFSQGFTSTQGANHWSYWQWNGATYTAMTWDPVAGRWQGANTYCLIGAGWAHPDGNEAAIVWTAPLGGAISSQGTMDRPSLIGDGTRTRILKNGQQIWPFAGDQEVYPGFMAQHVVMTSVVPGDVIAYHLGQNVTIDYDTTLWELPPRVVSG